MAIDEKHKPLLTQIFRSELDYYKRTNDKTVLTAKQLTDSISTAESAILTKADRAIPKDEATIALWVDKLKQAGMDFVAEDKELNELRTKTLNEEEDKIRAKLAEINGYISTLNSMFRVSDENADYRQSIEKPLDEEKEIRQSSYDSQIEHWNLRKQEVEEKLSLLADIQASSCVFTLGGQ